MRCVIKSVRGAGGVLCCRCFVVASLGSSAVTTNLPIKEFLIP